MKPSGSHRRRHGRARRLAARSPLPVESVVDSLPFTLRLRTNPVQRGGPEPTQSDAASIELEAAAIGLRRQR